MESTTIGTIVMIGVTLALVFYIWKLRQRNIIISEEKPKVAGQDELSGAAKDPSQFHEPDDDALEMMQEILEDAAEVQGLTYEE